MRGPLMGPGLPHCSSLSVLRARFLVTHLLPEALGTHLPLSLATHVLLAARMTHLPLSLATLLAPLFLLVCPQVIIGVAR